MRVERERIEIPVAEGRMVSTTASKVGVVRLAGFSAGAHGFVREQVDRLLKKGADGIVLDLRGNGGGLLSEAVLVSSIFIEDGRIVSVRGRNRPNRTEDAVGDAIPENVPVVVLVDRGSASASEIVTGALRDRGRATVVGTRTYGKGLVQEVIDLSNGGVLDLTVANYYLPGGEDDHPQGAPAAGEGQGRPGHEARRGAAHGARHRSAARPRDRRRHAARRAPRGRPARGGAREARPLPGGRAALRPRSPHRRRARAAPDRATSCWWAPASAAPGSCGCSGAPTAPATWWRA